MHPLGFPYVLGMIAFFYGFFGGEWKKDWPRKRESCRYGIVLMTISMTTFLCLNGLK